MSDWIKCSDKLPQKNELVGFSFDGKTIRKDIYYPGFNGDWESVNSAGWYISEKNVTHWMPLPNPPDENLDGWIKCSDKLPDLWTEVEVLDLGKPRKGFISPHPDFYRGSAKPYWNKNYEENEKVPPKEEWEDPLYWRPLSKPPEN